MRELPPTGPLLLPTLFDILAPATRGLFGSAFRLILLGLMVLVPIWLFSPKKPPETPVRGAAHDFATEMSIPLRWDGTDEGAPDPTAAVNAND